MEVGQTLFYFIALGIVLFAVFYGDVIQKWYGDSAAQSDHELIRTYLLNDSPLYSGSKPKLWVHTKYEINARSWKSFQSRNSTDLNQPYIHSTVQSIVNMCGDDFHVCLIDDESFSKLVPDWNVDLRTMADPIRSHIRQIGLCKLVYHYGGVVVPDSFVCMRSLMPLYKRATSSSCEGGSKPFVAERLNRTRNVVREQKGLKPFIADAYFIGAKKADPVILEYIEHMKDKNRAKHFSSEHDFEGSNSWWLEDAVHQGRIALLDGEIVGVKDQKGEPILLEQLLGEEFIDVSPGIFGVYIPSDEILKRTAYQWFAVMPREQIFESRVIVAKYLAASLVKAGAQKKMEPKKVPKALDSVDRIVII